MKSVSVSAEDDDDELVDVVDAVDATDETELTLMTNLHRQPGRVLSGKPVLRSGLWKRGLSRLQY
jgi:hypothetical protein